MLIELITKVCLKAPPQISVRRHVSLLYTKKAILYWLSTINQYHSFVLCLKSKTAFRLASDVRSFAKRTSKKFAPRQLISELAEEFIRQIQSLKRVYISRNMRHGWRERRLKMRSREGYSTRGRSSLKKSTKQYSKMSLTREWKSGKDDRMEVKSEEERKIKPEIEAKLVIRN